MAIKGKGRTKSRPTPRAPRQAPVVRKPPFLVRRWVQVVAALLAGGAIVTLVVWATNGLRADDRQQAQAAKDAAARRVIQQWQTTVEGALAKVGSSQGLGSITVLPTLTTSVDTLAKGDPDKNAQDTADTAVSITDEAVKTLQGVDLPKLITDNEGLDVATTNYVLNSKARMVDGLQLYGRAAAMVKAATAEGVDPDVSVALIDQAKQLLPVAKQVFDEGYTDYTQALGSVGLLQPTAGAGGGLSGLSPGLSPNGGGASVPST